MMDALDEPPIASAFLECLPRIGLEPGDTPAILAAERYSRRALRLARAQLSSLDELDPERATATFAFGSLGRLEASSESDLDLAFLYDSERIDRRAAEAVRERVIERLAELFDIPQKTFDQAIDLRSLTCNIGGRLDTNETLTYRALLLTEGAWLAGGGRRMKHAVFRAYADAQISRGRFLASLGNDLHRYYRTLCMDYRHKVEELDKSWAIRVLKLRHSRKLWHLANLALQCWAVDAIDDDDSRDVALASRIGWPSLLRLFGALEHFDAAALAREPFLCFDRFLAALADPQVRGELVRLAYEDRNHSSVYRELHENAGRLDAAAAAIVQVLFDRCRDFVVRFCIL
jgi:predicted nucleotidyltransferase